MKLNLPSWYDKTSDKDNKDARLDAWKLAVETGLKELSDENTKTWNTVKDNERRLENSVNLVEHNLAVLADSLENLTDLFKHSQEPKQKPAISTSQAPFAIVNPTKSEPKQEPAKSQSWLDLLLNRRK